MNINPQEVQQKAIALLKDGKGKYNDALTAQNAEAMRKGYDTFIEGIELLVKVKNFQSDNQVAQKMYNERIGQYMGEAKEMQVAIKAAQERGSQSGGGGKGKGDGGKDDKEDLDPDNAKFRDALSGAIVRETPDVSWDDVAGLENAKKCLKEAITLPIKFPDIFQGIRQPWKGILMYGPPGTGKTFLAKACATMADATFFSISSADLISKWVGESEKLVKALFEMARAERPSIIFIDEIDSLVSARGEGENEASRRVKTEFLVQMQGVGNKADSVLVLGATNFPWGLDPAMRRRFEKRVYIPLPDFVARRAMLENLLEKYGGSDNADHNVTAQQMDDVAEKLDGYSGSDIATFINNACIMPLQKSQSGSYFRQVDTKDGKRWQVCSKSDSGAQRTKMTDLPGFEIIPPSLNYDDLVSAFSKAKKSVAPEDLIKQEKFTEEFGMEG